MKGACLGVAKNARWALNYFHVNCCTSVLVKTRVVINQGNGLWSGFPPLPPSATFPRTSPAGSQATGLKVEHIALESTRIGQSFPLISISVSHWLFNGTTGHRLPGNPSESRQLWEGFIRGPTFEASNGALLLTVCSLCRVERHSRGWVNGSWVLKR